MKEPTNPDWDWRRMNEEAGTLRPDDCRYCSGMGRVPTGQTPLVDSRGITFHYSTRYGDCPECKGTGKSPNPHPMRKERGT
jgi:hypothetical protein